jgi:serine/threonine protein kinase/tetratricopeptide (TPR) repeat protein
MTDAQSFIGKTISHYRIVEKLGAGGMGVVYKALDLKLERTVALKFLPHDAAVDAQDKERFLREARSASALDHENIGVIHGLDEGEDGQLFIVMGYYEGETLQKVLRRGGLPVSEGLGVAVQVARGLAAAHARKIVHRDIKPSNIIITPTGVVKIVDFGLARVAATASMTQSMAVSGTPAYMSPEQTTGGVADPRSDVWALGVVMVEIFTGAHPFQRENTAALTFAILNQPPAVLDAVPPLIQPIVYRALAKDPAHRYSNAGEMCSEMESVRAQITAQTDESDSSGLTATSVKGLKQFRERASTPQWPGTQKKKMAWGWLAGMAVAVLAGLLLFIPPVRERVAAMFGGGGAKHIAVLPFENIGNNPADEPVAQGLMDSLTSKLSNLGTSQQSLWVLPASVVVSRKVTDPATAFRELGATLVVTGSIHRVAQVVHLTVNLIDTQNLRQIGSAALEDRGGDLAALQDEAVARLARLMKINVTAEMIRATEGSAAPAAYESYLKALGYMQRYDKPGNLQLAIDALKSAVETDAHFALGFGELGEVYRLKYQTEKDPRWIEEALANCKRALELQDRLPSVYVTLGRVHDATGKADLAVQEFQHALQLDPRNADALNGMAHAYENAGRTKDAEAAFQQVIALRPDYWDGYNTLALFYDRQRRYDEAIAQQQKALKLTPDNALLYFNLGAFYLDTGDLKKHPAAEEALRKSIALSPTYAAYANLGILYLQEKRYEESAQRSEKALQQNDKDYVVWDNLAAAYEWLKIRDKAAEARARELELVEKEAEAKGRDAQIQSVLGVLYAQKKLRDKALPRVQAALALSPDDPGILANIGEAYEDLGERREAIKFLERSMAKGTALEDLRANAALQDLLSDPNFRPPSIPSK